VVIFFLIETVNFQLNYILNSELKLVNAGGDSSPLKKGCIMKLQELVAVTRLAATMSLNDTVDLFEIFSLPVDSDNPKTRGRIDIIKRITEEKTYLKEDGSIDSTVALNVVANLMDLYQEHIYLFIKDGETKVLGPRQVGEDQYQENRLLNGHLAIRKIILKRIGNAIEFCAYLADTRPEFANFYMAGHDLPIEDRRPEELKVDDTIVDQMKKLVFA